VNSKKDIKLVNGIMTHTILISLCDIFLYTASRRSDEYFKMVASNELQRPTGVKSVGIIEFGPYEILIINYNCISETYYKSFFSYAINPHHHLINTCHISI
jgi:hypothetical protein